MKNTVVLWLCSLTLMACGKAGTATSSGAHEESAAATAALAELPPSSNPLYRVVGVTTPSGSYAKLSEVVVLRFSDESTFVMNSSCESLMGSLQLRESTSGVTSIQIDVLAESGQCMGNTGDIHGPLAFAQLKQSQWLRIEGNRYKFIDGKGAYVLLERLQ